MGVCSSSCQSEHVEGQLGRISHPGNPRSGIQFNRQGVFPSGHRNFQRDPGSLDLSYRAKGTQGMCARGCTFHFELELLPSIPGSGVTALKKETLRSAFSGASDTKFTGCGISEPPSGKKRKLWCACQPLFEVRSSLIQQETSS